MWVALLVLAEEAPTSRSLHGRGHTGPFRTAPIARLTLLLIGGLCAAAAVEWWQRPPMEAAVSVLLATGSLFLLAEGIPRALGILMPGLAATIVRVVEHTLPPFTLLAALLKRVERRMGRLLPPAPRERSAFGLGQRDMLLGLLSLRDRTVDEAMTPRLDIVALDTKASAREVVDLLRRTEHARIPIYGEDLDNIIGVLYAKDLTPAAAGIADPPANWHELVRPPQFVPESKSLAAQLREFQQGPSHLAIVVDEFGGTSGLVTLEDILEEVVGEIYDESDVDEEPAIEQEGTDRFWVDGRLTLDDLEARLGAAFGDEDIATVGGLVYAELGRVPQPGEELRIGEFRVVVEQVVRRRVRRVYFERLGADVHVEAASEDEGR